MEQNRKNMEQYKERAVKGGGEFVKALRSGEAELKNFWEDESGIGVIEIVLILVVLIGLVIIFKGQINTLLGKIFEQINSLSESVY